MFLILLSLFNLIRHFIISFFADIIVLKMYRRGLNFSGTAPWLNGSPRGGSHPHEQSSFYGCDYTGGDHFSKAQFLHHAGDGGIGGRFFYDSPYAGYQDPRQLNLGCWSDSIVRDGVECGVSSGGFIFPPSRTVRRVRNDLGGLSDTGA